MPFDLNQAKEQPAAPARDNPLVKKKEGFFFRNRYILLAFAVPFLLMLYAFAQNDLFPFGDKQIMVIDMWHQYFPFLKVLQEKLTSFDSLLYTWDTGLGSNFLNLIAYYASSPLNLITVFFPVEYLREAMALIVLMKIGLSGAFFAIYLRGLFKKCDIGAVAFSTLYALCAYAMGYYWCLMWLDVMAMLPLVVLGVHKIIDEGKYRLFVISLGIAIIANYYIAMMMCIFVFFYYFILYFSKRSGKEDRGLTHLILGWVIGAAAGALCGIVYQLAGGNSFKSEGFVSSVLVWAGLGLVLGMLVAVVLYLALPGKRDKRDFLATTLRMGASALGGVALSAVLLLPTWFGMQNAYAMSNTMPQNVTFYNPIMDVFNNLLTAQTPTVRGGLPNIACGMLSIMLALLFLMNNAIKMREKILNVLFMIFLFLSMNINVLDFLWHGTHFPNELPYRFSFVFSFVLLTMAYQCYVKIDYISAKQIAVVMAGGVIYLALVQKLYTEITWRVVYLSGLFAILYGLVLLFHKKSTAYRSLAGLLIFCVVLAESAVTATTGAQAVGNSDRVSYTEGMPEIEDFLEQYADSEDDFYRTELSARWTCNPSALYGYKGVSQFSSAANSNVSLLMQKLGVAANQPSNRYIYDLNTPLLNSMLNLKYIIGKGERLTDDSLTLVYQKEIASVEGGGRYIYGYENEYYLPIAFMVDSMVENWNMGGTNPFNTQNQFASFATGVAGDVFEPLSPEGEPSYSNLTVSYSSNTDVNYSSVGESSGSITYTYRVTERKNVYVHVTAHNTDDISASATNGMSASGESGQASILSLGTCQPGDTVTVTIKTKAGQSGSVTALAYTMDQEQMDRVYAALQDEGIQISDWSSTGLKGTIEAKEDGLLYTSIPYEKGWTVKVDGVKQEVTPIQDAFIAVHMTSGVHEVEFSYIPQGFVPGVILTLLAIAVLIILYVLERRDTKLTQLLAFGRRPSPGGDLQAKRDSGEPEELPASSVEEMFRELDTSVGPEPPFEQPPAPPEDGSLEP